MLRGKISSLNYQKHMKTFFAISFLLTFLCLSASAQQKNVESSFCKLSLSEDIKRSHATFTNRYYFRLNGSGKPLKISRVSGFDFINDDEVKDCISNWKFENFAENSYFIIEIAWKHGVGWQPMKIRSKNYSKTVKPS